jgi:hypothetical protein
LTPIRPGSEPVTVKNPLPLEAGLRVPGSLSLFGFPSTQAELDLLPRSRGWRALRAAAFLGGGLAAAPIVGLFPPHAPWATAALAIGAFFGLRKWRERFTILALRGLCPKCGAALTVRGGTPLKAILSVPCDGCNHESRLRASVPD